MTIEEKARAYDEALERAKSWAEGKVEVEELGASSKSVAEFIFPELKESEDERIRKSLIKFLTAIKIISEGGRTTWAVRKEDAEMCKSFLAYLERQKEQNGEDEFLEDELSAFLQNYDKEYDDDAAVSDVARHFYEIGKKQNEQKPHTDEEKEYIRTIKSIISDFIRDKKPENLAYYQRIYDWLDGRHVPFSCGHENGKSAEWAELRTEFNINEAFEDGKKEVIDHPDKYGLTKQKPVESIEGGVLTHLGNED